MNKSAFVIYSRVSTNEQDERTHIEDIINKFGLNQDNITIFREKITAYKQEKIKKRVELQKVKKLIENNAIESLYVWDVDRIFRNRRKLVEFLRLCTFHKVKVYSYRQEWLSKLNDFPEPWNEIITDLMNQVIGWMAEEESDKKSDRVKSKVDKSTIGNTKSIYGNKWGRKNLSNKAIKKIISFHNEGMSIREISKNVKLTTNSNNQKNISIGAVHKTIKNYEQSKIAQNC